METLENPTYPTSTRKGKRQNELAKDYLEYVTECNSKVLTTGDTSFTALPEHLWRNSVK
jgi:hypothetical protein